MISMHYGPLDQLEKYVVEVIEKRREIGS